MKADKANDIKMGGEGGGELRHCRPAGGGTELRSVEGVPARSACAGATRGRRDAVGGTLSTAARPARPRRRRRPDNGPRDRLRRCRVVTDKPGLTGRGSGAVPSARLCAGHGRPLPARAHPSIDASVQHGKIRLARSQGTLPGNNLRYREALDWRKWTKGGCSFPFVRAVLIKL